MTPIAVDDLTVSAGGAHLVGPVSFSVAPGTTLGLCGPSGAGKSTVLRALVGLLAPGLRATGRIRVLGQNPRALRPYELADLRARVVLVGQEPVLFPGSVLANATFGLRHVVPGDEDAMRARAREAIREAGLWDEVAARLDDAASNLSVGQRQRLCLARALALRPEVLLLDEPTSALDERSRADVERTLHAIGERRTMVLVSHDRSQLAALADSTLALDRDGYRATAPTTSARPSR